MDNFKKTLSLLLLMTVSSAQAQDVKWDKNLFPDYNPTPNINKTEQTLMRNRVQRRKAEGKTRPDHWNNALSNAFPAVMNQSAGSCGSASRIYYMFTHEMNAARWADASKAENVYPTHFTWLLTWVPSGQGKEDLAQHTGIPNSEVYGGYTYSEYFGYQDCDTKDSNYGWMQGYDKWFSAMSNRITSSANFPAVNTEEGREIVKNYLWNHCGDETFSTGGIVGVGVAMSPTTSKIPKTDSNDAAGVTGMKYVQHWGESVNHALTIVGYDDRIEFDLDGNGVKGEVDKDEVGAWIIVNSWGGNWENKGFVYCPYAEARPTSTSTSYWAPEYYTARREYRPLRTLKIKMDYDHRSEIALYVGASTDLNATAPEKEIWLRHFYYAGLGKGVTVSASNPDPAIPMLGKWADGELHTEPMEFGYDLTDLVSEFESGKPLKYFFRVETRAWAQGAGTIHSASIMDYTIDKEGVETPFDIAEGGVAIANAGKKTTITTVARADNLAAPCNLAINEGTLSWEAPKAAPYPVHTYNVFKDNTLLKDVEGTELSTTIDGEGSYAVSAIYDINGETFESEKSAVIVTGTDAFSTNNDILRFTKNGAFTIKNFTNQSLSAYTIEFWMNASTSTGNGNFGMKASSGKFFFKINASKRIEVGFDGGDYTSTDVSTNRLVHVAIVVNGTNIKVYNNGVQKLTWNSGYNNSGINGANDLYFGKTEGTTSYNKQVLDAPLIGYIDELRTWNYARSAAEIKSSYQDAFTYPMTKKGLTHYYKMNTRVDGETTYLVDAVGGSDAALSTSSEFTANNLELGNRLNPLKPTSGADFTPNSTSVVVGSPLTVTDNSAPSTALWEWTVTGGEKEKLGTYSPVIVFKEAGEQTITLKTTNTQGTTAECTKTVTVTAAEAPVADFVVPEGEIAAGEHITFLNTSTPLDNAQYTWTMEGATVEETHTVNAAATYETYGTYKVRLTATTAAGSNTVEKEINIVKVAPEPAFTIQNNVALVGEKINLIDKSKFEPESWEWTISNSNNTYLVKGQSGSITIDKPGIYNVTLKATNDIGSNKLTRQRAITVCKLDGQTGLNFDGADDGVVASSPFPSRQGLGVTIEWWMYPGSITDVCCRLGDSEQTFMLVTNADRSMTAYSGGKGATSLMGYVVENEWHHYAVTNYSGTITFYRDGVQYQPTVSANKNTTKWTNFKMGGSDIPMNAIVDELRIWGSALTADQVKEVANGPIEDPENARGLYLYYDFNQSSGDVIDRSKYGYTGVRSNFGPDGDAWTNSKGIFYLNFEETSTDVTSQYMKNYQAPFTAGSGFINGTSRFKKLGSPWIQENSVVEGNVTTEFYVDTDKNNYLTLSTTWDGFADGVQNLKLYQTVTLPAGAYELSAMTSRVSEWNPSSNYLVAAEGVGLPDYSELSTKSLGYAASSKGCQFILTKETQVSLGVVSMQSGQSCHTYQIFGLMKSSFKELEFGEIHDAIESVQEELDATSNLVALGGLGNIRIAVEEPQYVEIFDLGGQLLWGNWVIKEATIAAKRGIYIVGRQKVVVR